MIEALTGDAKSKVINYWSEKLPYSTGVDVECKDVYNLLYGKVIFIGTYGGKQSVTIQITSQECMRYMNLTSVDIKLGDVVDVKTRIGTCKKFVHVEYCSKLKDSLNWVVRMGSGVYYKHDPWPVISGLYNPVPSYKYKTVNSNNTNLITLNKAQQSEFGDNRGDRLVEF